MPLYIYIHIHYSHTICHKCKYEYKHYDQTFYIRRCACVCVCGYVQDVCVCVYVRAQLPYISSRGFTQVSRDFLSHLELRHRCDYAARIPRIPSWENSVWTDAFRKEEDLQMGVSIVRGVAQNGWFIRGKTIKIFKMDHLGVPIFQETSKWSGVHDFCSHLVLVYATVCRYIDFRWSYLQVK